MSLRYTDKPYGGHGSQQGDDWRSRFPARARSMDSAPAMASKPIVVYEPDGTPHWALHHLGCWREVESRRDPFTGEYRTAMNGELINNPVRWSSS
jgi:hypothetical protein